MVDVVHAVEVVDHVLPGLAVGGHRDILPLVKVQLTTYGFRNRFEEVVVKCEIVSVIVIEG